MRLHVAFISLLLLLFLFSCKLVLDNIKAEQKLRYTEDLFFWCCLYCREDHKSEPKPKPQYVQTGSILQSKQNNNNNLNRHAEGLLVQGKEGHIQ